MRNVVQNLTGLKVPVQVAVAFGALQDPLKLAVDEDAAPAVDITVNVPDTLLLPLKVPVTVAVDWAP